MSALYAQYKKDQFHKKHPGLIEGLEKVKETVNFAAILVREFNKWQNLTDKQVAAAKSILTPKASVGETISVEAIEKMFETARNNGLKRPRFVVDKVEISAAPATGRNPGALYVKYDRGYSGKIVKGEFYPVRNLSEELAKDLVEKVKFIASSPIAAAKKYGHDTGNCSCCGRKLTDDKSVELGIGPVCAKRWGL